MQFSSRSAVKWVDFADLENRAIHDFRKESGSKDRGGGMDSLCRVSCAAFEGSLYYCCGEVAYH